MEETASLPRSPIDLAGSGAHKGPLEPVIYAPPSSTPLGPSTFQSSPTPAPGLPRKPVTIDDVCILQRKSSALMSDFSILQGEFAKDEFTPDHPFIRAFVLAGYKDYEVFHAFDGTINRLKQRITKRDFDHPSGLDVNDEGLMRRTAVEIEKLDELYDVYNKIKNDLSELRQKLEARGGGEHGVYDYQPAVQYQEIGNQVLPPDYVKPEPGSPKGRKRIAPASVNQYIESLTTTKRKRKSKVGAVKNDATSAPSAENGESGTQTARARKPRVTKKAAAEAAAAAASAAAAINNQPSLDITDLDNKISAKWNELALLDALLEEKRRELASVEKGIASLREVAKRVLDY